MKKIFYALVVLGLAINGHISPVWGAGKEERLAKLIAGAKKEGKFVFWNTDSGREFNQYIRKFKERYPFIEIEYWTSSAQNIVEKVTAEAAAGKYNVDFFTTGWDRARLVKLGLLKKYNWPGTEAWDPLYKDPENLWICRNLITTVPAYNTKLVSAAEAPQNWDDLVDPKWKGQISFETGAYELVLSLWKAWGKERTVAWLKKLALNKPLLKDGHTAQLEMLAAGEYKISTELFAYKVQAYKDKGAPVEWVRTDPLLVRASAFAIAEHAPHPNATYLYADWFTSLEGQQAVHAALQKEMPHPQVKSKVGEELRGKNKSVMSFEMTEHYGEAANIFRDIFLKK